MSPARLIVALFALAAGGSASAQEFRLEEVVSAAALGWVSPQSLLSTYWRASISSRARATAAWFTV